MPPQYLAVLGSFLQKHWKAVLFTFLIPIFVIFGLIMIIPLACGCMPGLTGNIGGEYFGSTGSPNNTTNNNGNNNNGQLESDCFVKLVQSANSQVSRDTALEYKSAIQEAGNITGVNPAAIAAVSEQESTWTNHNCSYDKKSRGLMQMQTKYQQGCSWGDYEIWKDEAIPFAKKYGATISDIMNPRDTYIGGAAILKRNLDEFNGNYYKAFAAYNAGVGGASNGGGQGYASEVQNRYDKYQKCISSQTTINNSKCNTNSIDVVNGDYIIVHWSAGGYDSVHNDYHYNIKGNGEIVKTAGGIHASKRGGIGVSVCAGYGNYNSSNYPNDSILGTNTFTDTPIKQEQLDCMIEIIAKIAKTNNIPVDIKHIFTHAEAGALKDYSLDIVKKFSKPNYTCGKDDDGPAIAAGLPHCNYGPGSWKDGWPGGAGERWDLWEKGDEIRSLVKQKMNN